MGSAVATEPGGQLVTGRTPLAFPLIADDIRRPIPPLITNGGRHTGRNAAEHFVPHFLIQLAEGLSPDRRAAIEGCQRQAIELLVPYYDASLVDARRQLAAEGADWLFEKVDRADEALAAIGHLVLASKGSALEAYWSRPEIQLAAWLELAHELRTLDWTERSWWVDEHPESNAGAAWRARHQRTPEGAAA